MCKVVCIQFIVAVTFVGLSAPRQTRTSPDTTRSALAFDVASIKTSRSGSAGGLTRTTPGGRFVATNASLRMLLRVASGVPEYGIVAAPSWIDSARYDIDARPVTAATAAQVREMVATLLADRFGLRTHSEHREGPVYELRINNIKKLQPVPVSANSDEKGLNDVRELTMSGVASTLSRLAAIGRHVLDRTSLDGRYRLRSSLFLAKASDSQDNPSIFTRLRDEGLELRAARDEIDVLVIDAVVPPATD